MCTPCSARKRVGQRQVFRFNDTDLETFDLNATHHTESFYGHTDMSIPGAGAVLEPGKLSTASGPILYPVAGAISAAGTMCWISMASHKMYFEYAPLAAGALGAYVASQTDEGKRLADKFAYPAIAGGSMLLYAHYAHPGWSLGMTSAISAGASVLAYVLARRGDLAML